MIFLYNLGIGMMRILALVMSVFNPKARAFVRGRRTVYQTLQSDLPKGDGPLVWIHCASLGEFEQGRPVIEALKRQFRDVRILLTFFSPSGYEVRKNYELAGAVTYLPWDTKSNAAAFIAAVKPSLAIFVKYEFWYHFYRALHQHHIPILSISAIFRPEQVFFKSYGGFYRGILQNVTHFFVQNRLSAGRLSNIGIKNTTIAGDTRFDRVQQIVKDAAALPAVEKFRGDQKVMVIGSSWPEDMAVLNDFINTQQMKFIIAPHEVSEGSMTAIETDINRKTIRYSQLMQHQDATADVLIIDNVGMLSRIYRYGDYAYVGGAFGKGLHNILEAACYGMPVFFGNKSYQRFQEAVDLTARGGAFTVGDPESFRKAFEHLSDPANYQHACDETRKYVEENLGATEKIMIYCRTLLS